MFTALTWLIFSYRFPTRRKVSSPPTRLILNCNTLSAFDHEFLLRKGYLTFLYPWRYFPNGFEPKDLVVNFLISRGKLTLLFPFRVLVFPHISSNSPDVISAFPLKFELLELFEGFQIFPLFQDYCLILYLRGRYYFTIGSLSVLYSVILSVHFLLWGEILPRVLLFEISGTIK